MKRRIIRFAKKIVVALLLVCGAYCVVTLSSGSSLYESFSFLWRFIRRPHEIGAIAPSSDKLAEALVGRIPAGSGRHLLEVGAGTGAVTQHIIKLLGPEDRLDIIELDQMLAERLQQRYYGLPNIRVFHGSILQWTPGWQYDAIVSGIPFNVMKFAQVKAIFERYKRLLKKGGVLSYFSYAGMADVRSMMLRDKDRDDFQIMQDFLADQKERHGYAEETIIANLPPANVYYLRFIES